MNYKMNKQIKLNQSVIDNQLNEIDERLDHVKEMVNQIVVCLANPETHSLAACLISVKGAVDSLSNQAAHLSKFAYAVEALQKVEQSEK